MQCVKQIIFIWECRFNTVTVELYGGKTNLYAKLSEGRNFLMTYLLWNINWYYWLSVTSHHITFNAHYSSYKTGDNMLCTAQLPGPVLKAFERVQFSPLQLADKSPIITDQHTAGGSVSQLSQLAKLSPWLTLSTKDITTSFWHYKKSFCFLSNQIMGLYHFSYPTE